MKSFHQISSILPMQSLGKVKPINLGFQVNIRPTVQRSYQQSILFKVYLFRSRIGWNEFNVDDNRKNGVASSYLQQLGRDQNKKIQLNDFFGYTILFIYNYFAGKLQNFYSTKDIEQFGLQNITSDISLSDFAIFCVYISCPS